MNIKGKKRDQIIKSLLQSLWELSVFDNDSLMLFEKVVKKSTRETIDDSLLEEMIRKAVTARNKNLITQSEQEILRTCVVGFFGLSVGSHAAITWMMQSRADTVKIVDPDTISPTNLNRLRFGFETINERKTHVVKQELQKIHPYTRVIESRRTDPSHIKKLITQDPPVNIIVDAIDDLDGKILLRSIAKQQKIPLIMATDVGDNVIIDIERYDRKPQPEFFLGRVKNISSLNVTKLSERERRKLIINIVGFEENSSAMLDSLLSLGKTLPTWPQLGATATIAGGILTTVIKKIVLGQHVMSGRYYVSLDSLLVSDFNSPDAKKERLEKITQLKKKFDLV